MHSVGDPRVEVQLVLPGDGKHGDRLDVDVTGPGICVVRFDALAPLSRRQLAGIQQTSKQAVFATVTGKVSFKVFVTGLAALSLRISDGVYGSTFYVATGFHGHHMS